MSGHRPEGVSRNLARANVARAADIARKRRRPDEALHPGQVVLVPGARHHGARGGVKGRPAVIVKADLQGRWLVGLTTTHEEYGSAVPIVEWAKAGLALQSWYFGTESVIDGDITDKVGWLDEVDVVALPEAFPGVVSRSNMIDVMVSVRAHGARPSTG